MWTRSELKMDNFFLSIINIDNYESHTAQFTQFFVREFLADVTKFSSLLFLRNTATTTAAFDGRFDTDTENHRSGSTEHRLLTCITDSFSRGVISELESVHGSTFIY